MNKTEPGRKMPKLCIDWRLLNALFRLGYFCTSLSYLVSLLIPHWGMKGIESTDFRLIRFTLNTYVLEKYLLHASKENQSSQYLFTRTRKSRKNQVQSKRWVRDNQRVEPGKTGEQKVQQNLKKGSVVPLGTHRQHGGKRNGGLDRHMQKMGGVGF